MFILGIAKGRTNDIMTSRKRRLVESEIGYDTKKATAGTSDERKQQRRKLFEYYEGKDMLDEISHEDLIHTIKHPESGGIATASRRMKKHAIGLTSAQLRDGVKPFSIENVTLTREILRDGAKFPPERLAVETSDTTTMWSVPRGWKPFKDCDCHNCIW